MTLHYVLTTAYNVCNYYRFLKSKFAYNGSWKDRRYLIEGSSSLSQFEPKFDKIV